MASLLGDLSYDFVDYGVFLYYYMSEIVDNINGYLFIDNETNPTSGARTRL